MHIVACNLAFFCFAFTSKYKQRKNDAHWFVGVTKHRRYHCLCVESVGGLIISVLDPIKSKVSSGVRRPCLPVTDLYTRGLFCFHIADFDVSFVHFLHTSEEAELDCSAQLGLYLNLRDASANKIW
jgi:hypothetical protein